MTDLSSRALPDAPVVAATPRPIAFRAWEGAAGLASGTAHGTSLDETGRLLLDAPVDSVDHTDPHTGATRSYDVASWTSPVWSAGFGATKVIASWNAVTPAGTWLEVAVRGTTATGVPTPWYVMAQWCAGDSETDLRRTSVRDQADEYAEVDADVLTTRAGVRLNDLQLRVRLLRPTGSTDSPRLSLLALCASALPPEPSVPVSPGAGAAGMVVDAPAYSQMVHTGHYPEWNGGGEAWCSPTSTAMVLDHFGLGPTAPATDWVDVAGENRPQVDHLARHTFDHSFGGSGNWAFNTAYAGVCGARAYVTRLRSLTEAEAFIRAGIPLICSVSFRAAELDGAGYDTKGHLMVLVGFDARGDVVVNDPASHELADDSQVRVTYPRAQFENVWLPRSGGVVYVITPPGYPLPAPPDPNQPNWG